MQLRYRGTTYQAQETKVESTTSVETARFLGRTYIRYLPLQINKSQLGEKKYRGVVYG
jgi:hypothetical protein